MDDRGYLYRFTAGATQEDLQLTGTDCCNICMDGFRSWGEDESVDNTQPVCDRAVQLSCGHIFGLKCIIRTMEGDAASRKCPMCRQRPRIIYAKAIAARAFPECLLHIDVQRLVDVAGPLICTLDRKWTDYPQRDKNAFFNHLIATPMLFIKFTQGPADGLKYVLASRLRGAFYAVFEAVDPEMDENAQVDFEVLVEVIMWTLYGKYRVDFCWMEKKHDAALISSAGR